MGVIFSHLSFEGHEDSEAVEEMVASSEMFYLMPIFKAYQDIIKVDGKEWLQPALFTNLSWNDINAVCSADTGVCSGVLNDYEVTGWTWASVDDVNALFNHYIGRDELGPGPDRYHAESSGHRGLLLSSRTGGAPSKLMIKMRVPLTVRSVGYGISQKKGWPIGQNL